MSGRRSLIAAGAALAALAAAAGGADVPETPRIDSVVPLGAQPHEKDPAVIWHDDFAGPAKRYTESSGGLDERVGFGGQGGSMPCLYEKHQRGRGNRKVFFGDAPIRRAVRRGETFNDVYWRIYVKHQAGWTGGSPAKMSRATSIVSGRWNQAMIAHVWGGRGAGLTLDPASGVRGDRVVTKRYNDFARLRWLGNKPAAAFPISSTAESGWWVCVECRAKLNTPGRRDGLNQLWIDGQLATERKRLDWRGGYAGHGINAVFLEAYWNRGSPVRQTRWYDNFVISTKPIGPVVCDGRPEIIKTPFRGAGSQKAWQCELASDPAGRSVVWRSGMITAGDRARADTASGRFVGALDGKDLLAGGAVYYGRVRQQGADGAWSPWSGWHQAFATTKP